MLLTAIAERAEMRGWISVNVTDRDGMLSEIIVQLRQKASHILAPETNSWLSEIHVHGVGFTRTREEVPSTWRADMTKAVSELNEKDAGLLITVDEASAQSDVYKRQTQDRMAALSLHRGEAAAILPYPSVAAALPESDMGSPRNVGSGCAIAVRKSLFRASTSRISRACCPA